VDLSVVIVNWNTCDLLRNCLASLESACPSLEFEVLVVDNNSADGSARMVGESFPDYTLIPSGGNLGFSKGNNLAFPQCRGKFVLLLNPDTVCPAESLTKLVAWAKGRENLGAVSPLLCDSMGNPTITYGFFPSSRFHWLGFVDPLRLLPGRRLQNRVVHIPEPGEPSSTVDYIAGACFLVPRPALDAIGPLDERFFMYFEETDWCWRAHRAGLEIWYCNETEVMHLEGRAAEKASTFTTRQFQKSYRLFVEKNYGPNQVWKFRLSQFLEFSLKGILRSLIPWNRPKNHALAQTYLQRAKLQLLPTIQANIPK
jgi:N-acetylglucosaminyl-diphospho-decaprenol L-rhamnosyltransferase